MGSYTPILMFTDISVLLEKINKNLIKSNKILGQIEENLRVPNLVEWMEYKNKKKKKSKQQL